MILDNPFTEYVKKADLVIENGNNTYVCYRAHVSYTGAAEDAEIWKITLYQKTVVDGITTTKVLYPNGSEAYSFAPNNVDDYTFSYSV